MDLQTNSVRPGPHRRHLAVTQFPDITRAQTVGLIGGFFLLRFVNPAIVTPLAFMLIEAKLSPETRRNLTLLAKVLQNLANNTRFGGHKEFFMEPMNEFLEEAGARMNAFLEALCNVDDLDSHMQMDRYLTLAKHSDTTINITLNEMYFIHSLLLQHLDTFGIDNTAQVRTLLADLGPAPPQLPRADNSNVELVLRNPNAQESENLKPDQLLSETKYLLFTVLKAMPRLETQSSDMRSVLREIHQYATKQAKDDELTDRIKKIIANCNQLVDENVLKVDDNYARLRKETFEEVINYKLRIKRIEEDMTALQKVLDALHEHNNFLQGQHEAYQVPSPAHFTGIP
jgi:Ras GTPase-activating-like protein IQGAP2/3